MKMLLYVRATIHPCYVYRDTLALFFFYYWSVCFFSQPPLLFSGYGGRDSIPADSLGVVLVRCHLPLKFHLSFFTDIQMGMSTMQFPFRQREATPHKTDKRRKAWNTIHLPQPNRRRIVSRR